jgi:lysophospholipase L1-like esterase
MSGSPWTAVVALVAWGAGCAVACGRDADVRPVRVMSFNVRYGTAQDGDHAWPRRRDAVFDVIRAFEPDLLGMQEVLAFHGRRPADHPDVTRWEPDVAALEALDAREPDPAGAILFIGSSSVRLWESIAADMAPWPVVRRGYGGARYRDLRHFASRLVANHDPRAIVVFVANDISEPEDAPTVAKVMVDVRATLAAIRDRHPRVPVFFVAVTPTESRWDVWPEISRLNAAIEAMTDAEPTTFFVPTAGRFLDPATGRPIPALFRDDRLHLSQAGYAVWAGVIAAALDEVLAEMPAHRSP